MPHSYISSFQINVALNFLEDAHASFATQCSELQLQKQRLPSSFGQEKITTNVYNCQRKLNETIRVEEEVCPFWRNAELMKYLAERKRTPRASLQNTLQYYIDIVLLHIIRSRCAIQETTKGFVCKNRDRNFFDGPASLHHCELFAYEFTGLSAQLWFYVRTFR